METIRKIPVQIVHKEMENHGVTEIANGSMEIACPKVFSPKSFGKMLITYANLLVFRFAIDRQEP